MKMQNMPKSESERENIIIYTKSRRSWNEKYFYFPEMLPYILNFISSRMTDFHYIHKEKVSERALMFANGSCVRFLDYIILMH